MHEADVADGQARLLFVGQARHVRAEGRTRAAPRPHARAPVSGVA